MTQITQYSFNIYIFTELSLITSLKDKVILCHQYCPDCGMNAEGVPGIILISREVRMFRAAYDMDRLACLNRLDAMENALSDKMDALPVHIVEAILERVRVEGAVELRKEDIMAMIALALNDPRGPISCLANSIREVSEQQSRMLGCLETGVRSTGQSQETSVSAFGRLRPDYAGERFVFPSYSVWTMWGLWWFGNERDDIGPLRFVRPKQHCIGKGSSERCSRAGKVMSALVRLAITDGLITGAGEINRTNSSRIFDCVYPKLLVGLYDVMPSRPNDININTLANRLGKHV
jgi:hypothetical protein